MIQPPSPSWIDEGSSPMTAPTTHAVAATLNAEKRYGKAAGTRSFQNTDHSRAAYDSISSTAAGSADRKPRTVLTVTGKNVRYAAMTATRIQSVGVQPKMLRLPRPTTTIGASARIGIVCDATTYGMTPRCSTPNRAMSAPRTKPVVAPIAKPTAASLAVKSAASRSRSASSGSPSRMGSNSAPTMSWRCGIVVELTTNGRVHPVSIHSRRYPSQRAHSPSSTRTRTLARPTAKSIRLRADRPLDTVPHGCTCIPYHTRARELESVCGTRSEANHRRAEGAPGAHRRRERRATRRVDGDLG